MTNQDEIREISLETYTLKNIEKIKEFMFADLDKTIELVHSDKGAPNFMLALVLCAYTHFWGKLMKFSGNDKERFDAFFRKLVTKNMKMCSIVNMQTFIESGMHWFMNTL